MCDTLSGRGRLDHDQPVVAGLAAPDFAGLAVQLSDIGVRLVAGEDIEALVERIETHDRVGRKIGKPDLVPVIDIDRIGLWAVSRQLPGFPRAVSRIVRRDVAAVPFTDPDSAF